MNRSIFLRRPHEEDYSEYIKYLQLRTQGNTATDKIISAYLKSIHRKIYYLNYFVINLDIGIEGKKYLNEVMIDLILLMDLYSLNYMKNVRMSLRSSIEEFNRYLLTYNEINFDDLSISRINEKSLEVFKDNTTIHKKISMLCSDYADLCSFVHVSSENSFTTKLVLKDFEKVDGREAEKLARQISRNIENILSVLIILHRESFLSKNKHMQAYILQQLNIKDQTEISSLLA